MDGEINSFPFEDVPLAALYTKGEFEPLDPSWNLFAGQDTHDAPHIIHWPGPKKPWNTDDVRELDDAMALVGHEDSYGEAQQ